MTILHVHYRSNSKRVGTTLDYIAFSISGGLTQASKRRATSCQPEDPDYAPEKANSLLYLDKCKHV